MFCKADKLQFKVEHFIEEIKRSILSGREWEEKQFTLKVLQESWTEYIVSVTGMFSILTFSLKLTFASSWEFAHQS